VPFVVDVYGQRKSAHTARTAAEGTFVGRLNEIQFVQRRLIEPLLPDHNIIFFYGQSGVGKSTLLNQLEFSIGSDNSLFAYVNERQSTPVDVMQGFAKRLEMKGGFSKALEIHKETLRKLRQDRERAEETLGRKMTGQVAGLIAESVPVVGPLIKQGAEQVSNLLWDEVAYRRRRKDARHLEDPLQDLTQAFVDDLNKLAKRLADDYRGNEKQTKRIFLCFDTFEYVADQIEPWLLDYILEEDIDTNIILLIAGRNRLTHPSNHDPKRWLEYANDGTLHQIEIKTFSKDETRLYLSEMKISDAIRIDQIWQVSQGLPLYLRMLTVSPEGDIDLTENIVQNFLRWIPRDEARKRRLVVDASLFSRPFSRDDLKAFSYISDEEREAFYSWLLLQPFISGKDGRYLYHEVARNMFRRYLHQRSQDDCRAARSAIAIYYQTTLAALESAETRSAIQTDTWLEIALALVSQLLQLPDVDKHAQAIDLVVRAIGRGKDTGRGDRINKVLHELHDESAFEMTTPARDIVRLLLDYQEESTTASAWHAAAASLIQALSTNLAHAWESLTRLHLSRATRYRTDGNFGQALECCEQALRLGSTFAETWNHKGFLLADLKRFEEAVAAYQEAIRLDQNYVYAWFNQGVALFALSKKEEALKAFDAAILLQPNYADAHFNRGAVLYALGRRDEGNAAFDEAMRVTSLAPSSAAGRCVKGNMLAYLRRHSEALAAFNEAITLDPRHAPAWRDSGCVLLDLGRHAEAAASLEKALDINPRNSVTWNLHGCALLDLGRFDDALQSFQRATAINPQDTASWNNAGYVLMKMKRFDDALVSLTSAKAADPNYAHPWRWHGRVLSDLKRFDEALPCFEQALAINPRYAEARYDRAATLAELGRYEVALTAYEEALRAKVTDKECYEKALDFYCRAIDANPDDAGLWARKAMLLVELNRDDEASAASKRAAEIDPDYRHQSSGWSIGRAVSPDLVEDRFLDTEIVLLLQGDNLDGDKIYSYVRLIGRNLKQMFVAMQSGKNFKPSDFGDVVEAGLGEPSKDAREALAKQYSMVDVPIVAAPVSLIRSDSPEGYDVGTG
jgi:tetratricopeptide (TPR) repeat protein